MYFKYFTELLKKISGRSSTENVAILVPEWLQNTLIATNFYLILSFPFSHFKFPCSFIFNPIVCIDMNYSIAVKNYVFQGSFYYFSLSLKY